MIRLFLGASTVWLFLGPGLRPIYAMTPSGCVTVVVRQAEHFSQEPFAQLEARGRQLSQKVHPGIANQSEITFAQDEVFFSDEALKLATFDNDEEYYALADFRRRTKALIQFFEARGSNKTGANETGGLGYEVSDEYLRASFFGGAPKEVIRHEFRSARRYGQVSRLINWASGAFFVGTNMASFLGTDLGLGGWLSVCLSGAFLGIGHALHRTLCVKPSSSFLKYGIEARKMLGSGGTARGAERADSATGRWAFFGGTGYLPWRPQHGQLSRFEKELILKLFPNVDPFEPADFPVYIDSLIEVDPLGKLTLTNWVRAGSQ